LKALAVVVLLSLGLAAGAQAAGSISRLGWLAGCWKRANARRVVEEHWMAPGAGLMLGIGRTTNAAGDTLVEFEQTRIEEKGGKLVFTAMPSGQATDSFTSIAVSDSSVTFENKAHDFPQRVGYTLRADGSLAAWIEGTQGGKLRHVDFPYSRVACP
jgi:hypothetical protein